MPIKHQEATCAFPVCFNVSDLVSEGHNPVKGHINHISKSVSSEFTTISIWTTVKEQTCLVYNSKHHVQIDRILLQA